MRSEEEPAEVPRWLEPDEEEAWVSLTGLLLKLPAALDSDLRQHAGISHFEYLILSVLSETENHAMPMGELAILANSSPSRMTYAVARLEKKGWIYRRPDARNARFTLAHLTDDGVAFLRRIAPGHVATVRALVFDALDAGQVRQLDTLAKAILDKITTSDEWPPRSTRHGRPDTW
ncbi:MarR family transcriptional regulator [Streptomyces werraensis]|uniref:MarR family transcriptional regulator n=1 Tax=Streptomyces werraensis TaxID=68284 RepID=A0ABV3JCG6_9ACTN